MRYKQVIRKTMTAPVICVISLVLSNPVFAADSESLVKQIQKSFGPVKRHIVTQPKKAVTELSEIRALFGELKTADPENKQIPRIERQIGKLNEKLAKRLGKRVKRLAGTAPEATEALTPSPNGDAKLPGAVLSRIRQIDKSLEKTKRAMAGQSIQRAQFEFKAAARTYVEIQKRYQYAAPASHPAMVDIAERMAGVKSQIDTAAGAAAGERAVGEEAAAANKVLAQTWIKRMKPFITRDNQKYLDQTGWGNEAADYTRIKQSYGEAAAVLAAYRKVAFPLGKSMELQNTESGLQSVLDNLRVTYAEEDTARASEEWLAKLEPFVTSMGSKTLNVGFTSSTEQMLQQKGVFAEAGKLFDQYLKADFPLGKSPQLQRVEDELADRLAIFPETLQRSIGAKVGNAEEKLDQEIGFLLSKEEWKTDSEKLPNALSDKRINDAQKLVDTAAGLLGVDDPGLKTMQEKIDRLISMNDERRTIRAERTRMIPDRFDGDGKKDIKEKANNLVTERIADCQILRTTVVSEDWKEETVQEWTDTIRSATRFRTTRSVTTQVAAKKGDGEVRLFTLSIAKDRRSDGSWGNLYGNIHLDLGDLMLEENVEG